MEKNNINIDLRLRIKEYLRFFWEDEKNQFDQGESKILSYLPLSLRQEFLIASYSHILLDTPLFFINFSKNCLNQTIIENKLKQLRFTPGDIIFEVFIFYFINLKLCFRKRI